MCAAGEGREGALRDVILVWKFGRGALGELASKFDDDFYLCL